jgi:outer membrane receptor protein involved in Fe transport
VTTPLAGGAAPAATALPDHDESSLNPRLSLRVVAGPRLDLGLAAYRSFRGPTLNELFRSFRVGDTLTLANAELRAERLSGGEAGAVFRGRVATVSATGFWAEVRDPVANVTLAVAPRLVTRQRQNLGRTRSRGVELDADVRLGRVRLGGGYALTDGRVTRFPASPELVGRLLPQLPRHQASLRVSYEAARFEGAAALRVVGAQFEDDRNELRLRGFAVVDLRASLRLGAAGALFVAAENLFDRRYPVGLVPTPTIGPPRLVRVGARVGLGAVRSSPSAP